MSYQNEIIWSSWMLNNIRRTNNADYITVDKILNLFSHCASSSTPIIGRPTIGKLIIALFPGVKSKKARCETDWCKFERRYYALSLIKHSPDEILNIADIGTSFELPVNFILIQRNVESVKLGYFTGEVINGNKTVAEISLSVGNCTMKIRGRSIDLTKVCVDGTFRFERNCLNLVLMTVVKMKLCIGIPCAESKEGCKEFPNVFVEEISNSGDENTFYKRYRAKNCETVLPFTSKVAWCNLCKKKVKGNETTVKNIKVGVNGGPNGLKSLVTSNDVMCVDEQSVLYQYLNLEVELRGQLSSLRKEFEKLQDHLADVELRYQTAPASDGKEGRFILDFISSLFNQSQYSDVMVLLKGGKTLFGHKLVLASQSEHWGVDDFLLLDTLDLSDLDYEVGYTIIKWVYTSQLSKDKEDGYLVDLFKIAVRLQLQPLATRVQQLLIERVDTGNNETYHQLAVTLQADLLKSYCESLVFKCPIPELPVIKVENDDDYDDGEDENQDDDDDDNEDDDDEEEEDFTDIKEELEDDFEPKIRSRSTRQQAQTSKRKLETSKQKGTQPKKAKKKAKFNASRYIDESLSCFFCCVEYPDVDSLSEHLEEHNGQSNPYQCNKCDVKDLSTRKLLLRHLAKHKSKSCRFFEQEFDEGDKLKAHYATDHPKNARYKCLVCDKVYNKKTPYVIHLRVHTGEKPYTCGVCGRVFNEHSSLKVHFRLHTGIKPFICELCGKAYYSSTLLNKHIRLHDPNMGHPSQTKVYAEMSHADTHDDPYRRETFNGTSF